MKQLLCVPALCALLLAGCSGAVATVGSNGSTPSDSSPRLSSFVRNAIMVHMIDGATLDAESKFAEAILEYQEAVRLDPSNAAAYYALSRDYLELNKTVRAAETAREAVRLDSTNVLYREHLAGVYVNTFQRDAAIREYETILAMDSTQDRSMYNLAQLLRTQKPLRALELYEKLMDREGETWDLLLQTAEIYSALGQYDHAIDHYETMLQIDPGNDALRRQLAETYSKAGQTDKARAMLESMLEVRPDDDEVALVLADMYLESGETEHALQLLRRVLSHQDVHSEVRLRIGVTLFSQSHQDSSLIPLADSIFQQLHAEQPNDWRPQWYLGAIALNRQQDSTAIAAFKDVTRLEPRNGDAWWYLGSLYFERGKYPEVFEAMYKAEQTIPNDFRVYLLLGLAHSRVGEDREAVDVLYKAYKLNPKDINVLSTLALTLDGLKRFKESDQIYEEALRVDSTNALVLNNYGYSLSERNLQLDRALGMAQQAVAAEPNNPSYLDTIGWIYFKLGKYEQAREYIEGAIKAGEASAVVVEHLGDVYQQLGRTDDARVQWKRALDMSPDNAQLKTKLGMKPE